MRRCWSYLLVLTLTSGGALAAETAAAKRAEPPTKPSRDARGVARDERAEEFARVRASIPAEISPKARSILESIFSDVREPNAEQNAIRAIKQDQALAEEVVPFLIQAAGTKEVWFFRPRVIPDTPGVRACRCLHSMGALSVPYLVKALEDQESSVRARSNMALLLEHLRDARALPALIAATKADDPLLQESAVRALTPLRDRRAVPCLVKLLESRERRVRIAAIVALRLIGPQARVAVDRLVSLVGHEDTPTRWRAARALARIGDRRVVPPLLEALREEPQKLVRSSIIKALGEMGDPRATLALIDNLKAKDRFAREN
ncbi:MAG: HEAT repeat domain-containing protein, partial [Planctomycetota bacterium]